MAQIQSICEASRDQYAVYETEPSTPEQIQCSYCRVIVWAAFENHVSPMILGSEGRLESANSHGRRLRGLFENIDAAENYIKSLGAVVAR